MKKRFLRLVKDDEFQHEGFHLKNETPASSQVDLGNYALIECPLR